MVLAMDAGSQPPGGSGRSPEYPGIPLPAAVERARTLLAEEGRGSFSREAILRHWEFKPSTGAAFVAIAALKKFGLLEEAHDAPDHRFRLTGDAFTILMCEDTDPRRREAVRRAALRPEVHEQVWLDLKGELPPDEPLVRDLVRKRRFTVSGAAEFVRQFKLTLQYAGLAGAQERQDGDAQAAQATPARTSEAQLTARVRGARRVIQHQAAGSSTRTINLPIGDEWATLEIPYPLSEEAWDLMMSMLTAMKPGLVRDR